LLVAITITAAAQSEGEPEFQPGERWVVPTPPSKAKATAVILGVDSASDGEVIYVVAVETTFANPKRGGAAILAISEDALRSSVTSRVSVSEDLSRWSDVLDRVRLSLRTGEETVLRKPLQTGEWPAFDLGRGDDKRDI
jgi:hypothetical protein